MDRFLVALRDNPGVGFVGNAYDKSDSDRVDLDLTRSSVTLTLRPAGFAWGRDEDSRSYEYLELEFHPEFVEGHEGIQRPDGREQVGADFVKPSAKIQQKFFDEIHEIAYQAKQNQLGRKIIYDEKKGRKYAADIAQKILESEPCKQVFEAVVSPTSLQTKKTVYFYEKWPEESIECQSLEEVKKTKIEQSVIMDSPAVKNYQSSSAPFQVFECDNVFVVKSLFEKHTIDGIYFLVFEDLRKKVGHMMLIEIKTENSKKIIDIFDPNGEYTDIKTKCNVALKTVLGVDIREISRFKQSPQVLLTPDYEVKSGVAGYNQKDGMCQLISAMKLWSIKKDNDKMESIATKEKLDEYYKLFRADPPVKKIIRDKTSRELSRMQEYWDNELYQELVDDRLRMKPFELSDPFTDLRDIDWIKKTEFIFYQGTVRFTDEEIGNIRQSIESQEPEIEYLKRKIPFLFRGQKGQNIVFPEVGLDNEYTILERLPTGQDRSQLSDQDCQQIINDAIEGKYDRVYVLPEEERKTIMDQIYDLMGGEEKFEFWIHVFNNTHWTDEQRIKKLVANRVVDEEKAKQVLELYDSIPTASSFRYRQFKNTRRH